MRSRLAIKNNLPDGCPEWTPWGVPQHGEKKGEGVYSVSTASHGGFWVAPDQNAHIPEVFRNEFGWYEEDCDWAIVATFLSDRFDEDTKKAARLTLRTWRWKEWEHHFGESIPPGESWIKDQEMYVNANAGKLMTVAAWGDWHDLVPEGMVGVAAALGMSYDVGRVLHYFLVTKEQYDARSLNPSGSLVIDEAIHRRWEPHA